MYCLNSDVSAPNCKMTKTGSILLLNVKYMVWIYPGHTKSVHVHYKHLCQKLVSPPQSESRRINELKCLLSPKRKFASLSSGVLSTHWTSQWVPMELIVCSGVSDAPRTQPVWSKGKKKNGSCSSIHLIVSCCKQILLIPVVLHTLWVTHICDIPATVPCTNAVIEGTLHQLLRQQLCHTPKIKISAIWSLGHLPGRWNMTSKSSWKKNS